jgi:hypothetical protein
VYSVIIRERVQRKVAVRSICTVSSRTTDEP